MQVKLSEDVPAVNSLLFNRQLLNEFRNLLDILIASDAVVVLEQLLDMLLVVRIFCFLERLEQQLDGVPLLPAYKYKRELKNIKDARIYSVVWKASGKGSR